MAARKKIILFETFIDGQWMRWDATEDTTISLNEDWVVITSKKDNKEFIVTINLYNAKIYTVQYEPKS